MSSYIHVSQLNLFHCEDIHCNGKKEAILRLLDKNVIPKEEREGEYDVWFSFLNKDFFFLMEQAAKCLK